MPYCEHERVCLFRSEQLTPWGLQPSMVESTIRCQLLREHWGPHQFLMSWTDRHAGAKFPA